MKTNILIVIFTACIAVDSCVHAGNVIPLNPDFVRDTSGKPRTDSHGHCFTNIAPDGTVVFEITSPNAESRIDTDSSTFTNASVTEDDGEDSSDVLLIVTFNDSAKGLVNPCKFEIDHYDERDNYCADKQQEVDIDVNVIKLTVEYNTTSWSPHDDRRNSLTGFPSSPTAPAINTPTIWMDGSVPWYVTPYEYKVTVAPSGSYVVSSDVKVHEDGNSQFYAWWSLSLFRTPEGSSVPKHATYTDNSDGGTWYFGKDTSAPNSDPIFYWIDFPGATESQADSLMGSDTTITKGGLETILTSVPRYKDVDAGDTQTHTFDFYFNRASSTTAGPPY